MQVKVVSLKIALGSLQLRHMVGAVGTQVPHSGAQATHRPTLLIEKPKGQTQPSGVGVASGSLQAEQLVALPAQAVQVISQASQDTLLKKKPAGHEQTPLTGTPISGSEQVIHAEALAGEVQVAHEGAQDSQVPLADSTRGGIQMQCPLEGMEPGPQVRQMIPPGIWAQVLQGPGQSGHTPGHVCGNPDAQLQKPVAFIVRFAWHRQRPGEPRREAVGSLQLVQAVGSAGIVQVAQEGSQASHVPLTITKPAGHTHTPLQRSASGSPQRVQLKVVLPRLHPRQPGAQGTQTPVVGSSMNPTLHTHWPLTRVALGSLQEVQAKGSRASPQVRHEGSQGPQVLVLLMKAVPLGHTQLPAIGIKSPGHAVQAVALLMVHSRQGGVQGIVQSPLTSRVRPGGQEQIPPISMALGSLQVRQAVLFPGRVQVAHSAAQASQIAVIGLTAWPGHEHTQVPFTKV